MTLAIFLYIIANKQLATKAKEDYGGDFGAVGI
jgi:hypothetical protein